MERSILTEMSQKERDRQHDGTHLWDIKNKTHRLRMISKDNKNDDRGRFY